MHFETIYFLAKKNETKTETEFRTYHLGIYDFKGYLRQQNIVSDLLNDNYSTHSVSECFSSKNQPG